MTNSAPIPRPIKNQVLVLRDPSEDRIGSIYVPQGSERWPSLGTVRAVGGDVVDVAPGQRVLFQSKPASALIPDPREGGYPEWKGLVMLRDDDIIGIVEEE